MTDSPDPLESQQPNTPAHRPTRYTLDEVLAAIEKGVTKTGTARVLHVNRQTVINYCKRWTTVAAAFEDKRRELVDLSELALRGAVLKGEPWAVTFALRTLGKDEGYSERRELTGKDGNAIALAWDLSKLSSEEVLKVRELASKAAHTSGD